MTITASDGSSSRSANLTVIPAGGGWLDTSWPSRSAVFVASQSSATLTGFQVRLALDATFDFSSAKSDGSDVRVTRDDGVTPVPFWIESWNAAAKKASIWLKVPSVPPTGATLYLYYGNSTATTASSGNATFEFFDDFEPNGSSTVLGYYALSAPETVLVRDQSWENFAPHTLSVVQANSGGYAYWGYYGLQDSCGGVGLAFSNDLSHWTKYQGNPLFEDGRWPSVLLVNGTFYMVHTTNYCGDSYLVLATSTDGINFTRVKTLVPAQTGKRNQNPDLYHNPNDGKYYLYWFSGNDPYLIKVRSATTIEGLSDASSEKVVLQSSQPIAAPNMLFRDGTYFLSTEGLDGSGIWITNIYSSTSPTSGFALLPGNPVLADGNACLFQHVFGTTLHTYECKKTSDVWTVEHRKADLTAGRLTFPTQSLDTTKWSATGGSWQVVSDSQQDGSTGNVLLGNLGSAQQLMISSYQGGDHVLDAFGKLLSGRVWGLGIRVQDRSDFVSANLYEDLDSTRNLYLYNWSTSGASTLASVATGRIDLNAWYKMSLKAHGSVVDLYRDDLPQLLSIPVPRTAGAVALYGEGGTLAEFNNVLVRKYASVEPTATLQASGVSVTLASLSLTPSTVTGGDAVTGTIVLTGAAPEGGATVLLSSSAPALLSVPPSVTVPAQSSSITFTALSAPPSTVTTVTVTASYASTTLSQTVTVQPPSAPVTLSSVTIAPATIQGGATAQGTVTLSAAAQADLAVTLTSSPPGLVTMPATVTVAAGATSAAFTIASQPVTTTTSVTVSASYGSATQSATLTLTPPPLVVTTSALPSATVGVAYTATVAASGGGGTYRWSSSGLPAPLTMSTAGVISGTPTTTGTYQVTVQVQDQNLATATKTLTLAVLAATIAIDTTTSLDSARAQRITTASFATKGAGELLVAFVGGTPVNSGTTTVASVSNSGTALTWTRAVRTNAQRGTAEIWWAYASAPFSGSVTASFNKTVSSGSITVVAFTGTASGAAAIGAVGSGSAAAGAPTASVVTTRADSWIFAAGNDATRAQGRTVGANQSLVHQYLAPTATYWVQRQNDTTPLAGTKVTINDTAPTGDMYNLSVVEIRKN